MLSTLLELLPGLRRWKAAWHMVCDRVLEAAMLSTLFPAHRRSVKG